MVKSYLRYVADRAPFGVIASPNANALLHSNGVWAIAPAQEYIHIYHLQQGTLLHAISHTAAASAGTVQPPSVRVLCAHPVDAALLAAGYDDGSIRLFSLASLACTLTLHGHTAAVTCLAFHRSGAVLLSGGADTAVVCWDLAAQRGLVRLRGHRDAVTCIALLDGRSQAQRGAEAASASVAGLLAVSGSKDGSLRVWDVEAQHCRQSVLADKEVWGVAVSEDQSFVVSAGVDAALKLWTVRADGTDAGDEAELHSDQPAGKRQRTGEAGTRTTRSALDSDDVLSLLGSVPRLSTRRVVSCAVSSDGALLSVLSADRMVEMWTVRSRQQAEKRSKSRRRKRQQREAGRRDEQQHEQKEAEEGGGGTGRSEGDRTYGVAAEDLLSALSPLRTDVKIASVSLSVSAHKRSATGAAASHRILLSLADNSIALYAVSPTAALPASSASSSPPDAASSSALYSLLSSVELPGHRSPIRTLCLSSDHSLLLSGSSSQLKLHSLHSQQCVRTLQCGSAALCCLFVPGNKHVVVGCKDGSIAWYELGSARCLGSVTAHGGHSVYSVHLRPDGRGFASGGGDKCVRQWEFELVADEGSASASGGRVLSIVLARTLTLTDDVLCVRHSPDGKYVAVGLLDSTIKLFHSDTLLFFLSLYGHRLPVLSIDFSSDSQLLASASADKNVKVWGVAFGDCQCSLFAHADTVTQVRFIPRTHHLASAGKDGLVKLWDADARQCIQELPGHTTEVWALETAATVDTDTAGAGELLVSAGNDRSLRVWRQSDEMLFVDEEADNRRHALLDGREAKHGRLGDVEGAGQRVEVEGELVSTAATAELLKGAEGLLEAIDLAYAEKQRMAAFQQQQQQRRADSEGAEGSTSLDRALLQLSRGSNQPLPSSPLPPNPFLRGLSADAYVMSALSALPTSAIDDCLLQLPFSYALRLMDCLAAALEAGEPNVELAVSALIALLALHDRLIVSNRLLVNDMQRLRRLVRERLRSIKDTFGRNKSALQLLRQRADEQRGAFTFG